MNKVHLIRHELVAILDFVTTSWITPGHTHAPFSSSAPSIDKMRLILLMALSFQLMAIYTGASISLGFLGSRDPSVVRVYEKTLGAEAEQIVALTAAHGALAQTEVGFNYNMDQIRYKTSCTGALVLKTRDGEFITLDTFRTGVLNEISELVEFYLFERISISGLLWPCVEEIVENVYKGLNILDGNNHLKCDKAVDILIGKIDASTHKATIESYWVNQPAPRPKSSEPEGCPSEAFGVIRDSDSSMAIASPPLVNSFPYGGRSPGNNGPSSLKDSLVRTVPEPSTPSMANLQNQRAPSTNQAADSSSECSTVFHNVREILQTASSRGEKHDNPSRDRADNTATNQKRKRDAAFAENDAASPPQKKPTIRRTGSCVKKANDKAKNLFQVEYFDESIKCYALFDPLTKDRILALEELLQDCDAYERMIMRQRGQVAPSGRFTAGDLVSMASQHPVQSDLYQVEAMEHPHIRVCKLVTPDQLQVIRWAKSSPKLIMNSSISYRLPLSENESESDWV